MAGYSDELYMRKRLRKINTKTTVEEETATDDTKWEGEPVSPAGQLFHDPSFNCHIISNFGLGTPINNVDAVIEGLQATLVRHPRFSSIPNSPFMAGSPDELQMRKRLRKINTKTTPEEETAMGDTKWEGEPVSPTGQLFHDPSFNCHIISIFGLGTPINNVDAVIEGLQATLVRHPRFSSIPVLDESDSKKVLRWRPVEVNMKDHIIIPSLSSDPTSPSSNDQLVEDYVSSLSLTSVDRSRPLWEFHIINIPTTECAAIAVFRGHHSLGDGMSLISLLLACTRQSDDPTKLPSLPPRRAGPLYALPKPEEGIWAFLLWIFSFVTLFWHTLVDMVLIVASTLYLRDTETPLKGHKGVECAKKLFVHRTIQLDDVKSVKNAMGCTVNDVLVGVTSAALSRYLYRKHCETKDEKKFPRNTRVRSTLLVNIRPTPGIHALAEMMEEGKTDAKYGNRIGYMMLQFPIVIHEDPLDFVRQGMAIAARKKNSLEAIASYFNAKLIVKLFGTKVACALTNKVLMNTTLSFSNLMGPLEQICFYGHPIVYIAPSVYGHAHALTLHYQSYMNTMKVVMAVDESVISDSHQLLDDFLESLSIIRNAAENLSKKN